MAGRSSIEKEWCDRLRTAQQQSGISQAKMAKEMSRILGRTWRQSRVWKLLWCEMPITLSAFDAAVQALGLTLEDFVIHSRSGTGEFLDDGERDIIRTLRRTRTTEYLRRTIVGLCLENREPDKRATNGAKPKRKLKVGHTVISQSA